MKAAHCKTEGSASEFILVTRTPGGYSRITQPKQTEKQNSSKQKHAPSFFIVRVSFIPQLRISSLLTAGREYVGNFPLRNGRDAVGDSKSIAEASYFIYGPWLGKARNGRFDDL